MKNRIILLLTAIVFLFSACNDEKELEYKLHMSHNKAYEVEIPTDFSMSEAIGDLLGFTQENTHSFIIIQSLGNNETISQFAKNNEGNDNFQYSVIQQSDTSLYYKVTRGTTMWCAYQLYMTKKLDGKDYVVYVSSDMLSKNKLVSIIEHVQRSLKFHSQEIEIIEGQKDDGNDSNGAFVTRNTNYYSIDYPKEWTILTNPDQMTDLNEEGNANMRNAGAKITSNQKININGKPCYKTIFEFSLGDTEVKQVSYLFKKDETMYSVKFGNDKKAIDDNIALIDKIMSTFKIK